MLTLKSSRSLIAAALTLAALTACHNAKSTSKHLVSQSAKITDFGALADGTTINTKTIQATIDKLASTGGGTVIIPAGTFLSGSIFLKPGVNLHLDKDAILKGTTNIADYPTMKTRIEGHFQDWIPALVNADHCDHVVIDGEGTLDGSGTPFYAAFRTAIAANRATKNLDVPRPRMCFISNSSNAHVANLHFLNSGFWNLHLYHCDHVIVDGLDIHAPNGSPSTDGIDVDSSQYLTIQNCTIYNNDDGIALKGSKGPFALDDKDSPPDAHIHVTNCTFLKSGSVVTCGSEATYVHDVVVDHCTVKGPDSRGLSVMRLKLRPDTPQHYEDIHFSDITLDGAGNLVNVAPWRQYFDLMGQPAPKSRVNNITMSNIHGNFASFGSIQGNTTSTLEDITFENIDVKLTSTAPTRMPSNITLKNVMVNGAPLVTVEPPPLPAPAAAPASAPAR